MSQTFAQLINGKSATVEFSTGSASTPSVAFSGDTNTGIYSPGADQVAISTNGTGRLFVASDGKIGIGSSGSGTQSAKTFIEGSGACPLEIDATSASGGYLTLSNSGAAKAFFGFGSNIGTAGVNDVAIRSQSGALAFQTNGANERLRITSTGALNFVGAGTAGSTQAVSFNGSAPVNSLVIDSSGRVGIGTSSPQSQLQVLDQVRISNSSQSQGSIVLGDGGSSLFNVGIARWNGGSNTAGAGGIGYFSQGTTNIGGHYFYTGDAVAGSQTARMAIAPGGNVGIGTTSPGAALDVAPDANRNLQVQGKSGTTYGLEIKNGTANSGGEFHVTAASSGGVVFNRGTTEMGRFDGSSRLLVGTSSSVGSSPLVSLVGSAATNTAIYLGRYQAKTSITSGATLGFLEFGSSDGGVGAEVRALADANWGSTSFGSRLTFSTTVDGASSPTERVRINNAGAFKASLAGTYESATSSYHELRTNAGGDWIAYFTQTTTSNPNGIVIKYTGAAPNNTGSTFLYCEDNAAVRATIRSNGGFANYQANDVNLSDRNAKKDISPAAGTWDCIKEWEIVNYRYKDQPDDADLNLGVIAQQVAESCPEVITVFQEATEATEDRPAQEERLGVKEQQMYWMAIKALQEAQVRIEALEAEVAALKAQ